MMKPLLRLGVFLLVFIAPIRISRAECVESECNIPEIETLRITTTTVTFVSSLNCNFSIGDDTSENGSIIDLNPGMVYEIYFDCWDCCTKVITQPKAVTDLRVEDVNTTAVRLTWLRQSDHKPSYSYLVIAKQDTMMVHNDLTTTETYTFFNLTPGELYTFDVFTVVEGVRSTVNSTSEHARPEKPGHITVPAHGINFLNISWTFPEGSFDHFVVNISNKELNYFLSSNTTDTAVHFTDLFPGRMFVITVTAVAGTFRNSSDQSSFATFPTPPGSILITQKTNSSLHLEWATPALMEAAPHISYHITYHPLAGEELNKTTTENNTELSPLSSGTSYNITLVSVGPENLRSTAVNNSTFTLPNPVLNLAASPKSTTSVEVKWSYPLGAQSYHKYLVQTFSAVEEEEVFMAAISINSTDVPNLEPGSRYIIKVRTIASTGSESMEEQTYSYTKPKAVTDLRVEDVNTTAVRLTWLRQSDHKPSYSYLVIAKQDTMMFHNDSTTTETYTFFNLTPGELYTFDVFTVVEGVRSTVNSTSKYTSPGKPGNLTVTTRGTNYLNISWTLPEGSFDNFEVNISNKALQYFFSSNTTNTAAHFTDLFPGRMFVITVTAVAGTFRNSSDQSSFATFPTPPGSILITQKTNSSLHLEWATPALMEAAPHISYHITYHPLAGEELNKTTTENNTELSPLSSGTSYNITLVSVGPENLRSTAVNNSTFTLPNPVLNLAASPKSTTSVEVKWSYPLGAQSYYKYLVQTFSAVEEEVFMAAISINSTDVPNLEPGSRYIIKVRTIASTGSESMEEQTYSYTKPKAVTDLRVEDVNTTAVRLTWLRQSDHKPSYSYLVIARQDTMMVHNDSTTTETYTFFYLTPGELYTFDVFTVVEGVRSTVNSTSEYTKPVAVSDIIVMGGTTNLSVSWTPAFGRVSSYTVHLFRDNQLEGMDSNLSNNTVNTLFQDKKPGVLYCVLVTTKSGPFESNSSRVCNATFPNPPGPIMVESQTVNSINFTWPHPEDMDHHQYNFLVSSFNGSVLTEDNWFLLDNLQSGTQYHISIVTVGVWNYTSTAVTAETYTKPVAVSDIIVMGGTTNLSVSWTPAFGRVSSYTVHLFRDNQPEGMDSNLSNNTVNTLFQDKKPGVLYCVLVTTKSGPFESNSSRVCNATFPNPPGPIMVESQTVNSINFTWPHPEDMDHHQYNFLVSTFNGFVLTEDNWFLLDNLQSGTQYHISIVTVGVWNYTSTAVTAETYTKPVDVSDIIVMGGTTNLSVSWTPAFGRVSSYTVHLFRDNQPEGMDSNLSNNTVNTLFQDKKPGVLYCVLVTTKSGPFESNSSRVCNATFPNPPGPIMVESQTVNSINFTWPHPEDMDHHQYNFLVSSFNGSVLTEDNWFLLDNLQSGTQYHISIVTVGVWNYTSTAVTAENYTKPEMVKPSISSLGSNDSIWVSWNKPPGKVEYYKVHLNNSASMLQEKRAITNKTSWLFESLSAGKLYSAMVTTYSGPVSSSSGFVSNATFPNAPGPIHIQTKTTDSISIKWEEAPLMTGASFYYRLIITSSQSIVDIPSTNNSHSFSSLLSGTSYNMSVATVGIMDLESEPVWIHMVTTRPFNVKHLDASSEEDSITVMWDRSDEYKDSYSYNVTWQSSDGDSSNITEDTKYRIDGLVPGRLYNLSVTTETSDGTQGAPRHISICTNASSVTNLKCEAPDKTKAEVILSWSRPNGQHSFFQVYTNDSKANNMTSSCCNHSVSGLLFFTIYKFTVKTFSCGKPSSPVSCHCRTGITDPPIPDNATSLVEVSEREHNKFSIKIDSKLLNNINGPITHVGVLVTHNLPDDTTNWRNYLGNTYDQWKAKKTPVYLATVRENILQSRSSENPLRIEVGDGSKWEGYTNGVLVTSGIYQYSIVLFTSLSLQNNTVNSELSLVSSTNFYPPVELQKDPAILGIAIGSTLGIFAVLFIVLIGFIIYWRRLSRKESSDIQIHSLRNVGVKVEDYETYYRKQKADSNCGFAEEFEDLKVVGTDQSKTNALAMENKPKNRYNNVLPYDCSRVKLSIIHGSPYDDYINANYIPGHNSRKEFIASQGPLPATVNAFWRMIWEKNVQTLVMLTRCNEQGRVKCEKYWDSGTKHFENITGTTTAEIALEDWTIRDISIKNVKTAETRLVRQFHFTAWPDHGVPETTELLISFRHLVREHMDQYSRHSPTVVHCSAGVGRTGTFIAIDRLIFQIERDNIVDVYSIVHDMRMHRPLMVQTEDQYVFLNQCAMDIIRSRTGNNVDLIYQNITALSTYENVEPNTGYPKNGHRNA
ncbi:receptor-type tyrosine-protein phosphatase eta-like [Antennarius striatus]|uniref:receptor-type tyrosine-protein phosphatase eta-like n=1 Tax=Antennarius striatus TaxID=241820 RepID=UPI0035AF6835